MTNAAALQESTISKVSGAWTEAAVSVKRTDALRPAPGWPPLILSPTSPEATQDQLEICSSDRFVVRGPKKPIVTMTISIEAAMKPKTPGAPNRTRKN
jgi:hypothetical protein